VFTMDPSLLFAADGRAYYTRHGNGEHGGIYQAELNLGAGQLAGEPKLIWSGTGGIWPEGPHLYEIEGRYYLLISEGGTSTGHRLTIARSASPFGPFEPYAHNPILTHSDRPTEPIQATGHGDLVQASDGRWWIVFLGIRRWDGEHHHLGRETFLAPVEWNAEGWPIINHGAPIALEMNAEGLPKGEPVPQPSARDDFTAPSLGLMWNFLRAAPQERWSLGERPGFLRLHGSAASLDSVSTPAFVGRRQRHFRSYAAARLEFEPGTPDERAGLTVRANEANHHDLVVVRAGSERRVQLWSRVAGTSSQIGDAKLSPGAVTLRIESFPDRYVFSAEDALGNLHELGNAPTAPLSSESAGGFTGVYFGMFATSGGAAAMPVADFDWFEYRPLDAE